VKLEQITNIDAADTPAWEIVHTIFFFSSVLSAVLGIGGNERRREGVREGVRSTTAHIFLEHFKHTFQKLDNLVSCV
jgi:hypothetical protein